MLGVRVRRVAPAASHAGEAPEGARAYRGISGAQFRRVERDVRARFIPAPFPCLGVGGGGQNPLLSAPEFPSPAYDLQSQKPLAGIRRGLAPRRAAARRLNPGGTSAEQFICCPASSSKRRGRCGPRPIRCWGPRRSAGHAPGSHNSLAQSAKANFYASSAESVGKLFRLWELS